MNASEQSFRQAAIEVTHELLDQWTPLATPDRTDNQLKLIMIAFELLRRKLYEVRP